MGHHKHRQTQRPLEFIDQIIIGRRPNGVEAGGGFIQKHNLWIKRQGAGEGGAWCGPQAGVDRGVASCNANTHTTNNNNANNTNTTTNRHQHTRANEGGTGAVLVSRDVVRSWV